MSRVSSRQAGAAIAEASHSFSAGMPSSLYTPAEARSLVDTSPTRSSSFAVIGRFLQEPKHFAVSARRFAVLRFLLGVPEERAQGLQVGARQSGGRLCQRVVVG